MLLNYPNDSDGDALRRVAAGGSDMTAPMVVEFPVVAASPIQRLPRVAMLFHTFEPPSTQG
jgi:hypothetical protein